MESRERICLYSTGKSKATLRRKQWSSLASKTAAFYCFIKRWHLQEFKDTGFQQQTKFNERCNAQRFLVPTPQLKNKGQKSYTWWQVLFGINNILKIITGKSSTYLFPVQDYLLKYTRESQILNISILLLKLLLLSWSFWSLQVFLLYLDFTAAQEPKHYLLWIFMFKKYSGDIQTHDKF